MLRSKYAMDCGALCHLVLASAGDTKGRSLPLTAHVSLSLTGLPRSGVRFYRKIMLVRKRQRMECIL